MSALLVPNGGREGVRADAQCALRFGTLSSSLRCQESLYSKRGIEREPGCFGPRVGGRRRIFVIKPAAWLRVPVLFSLFADFPCWSACFPAIRPVFYCWT